MTSSLTLRDCRGGKSCSRCDKEIKEDERYWSGPYKAFCVPCYDIVKTENAALSKVSNNNYIVSGTCEHCPQDAIGVLWGKKVCAAHINQAITESI